MKKIKYSDKEFQKEMKELFERKVFDNTVEKHVAEVLNDVKKQGDLALSFYAKKFDNVTLKKSDFLVSDKEISFAKKEVSVATKKAIKLAYKNVTIFAKQKIPNAWTFSPRSGVILGERYVPLDRVACYIPGGTAPLVSTVLHTVSIAKAAGVKEIIVLTPARKDKSVHPAILYACEIAGATQVYKLGGVYGIGAAAYGTETIKKVEKIVGPGNQYVSAAKK